MRQTSGLARLAALAMLCVPLLSAGAQADPAAEAAQDWEQELYTVHDYDAARDPAADLALTLERAMAEHKTVLLIVGGEWCIWCKIFTNYVASNEAVRGELLEDYLIQKVNFSRESPNEAFLSAYPEAKGYPYFIMLAPDGSLLTGQETGSLEDGRSYDQEKVLAFLKTWAPTP
jgi:thiol:disulfide interchange protein